MHLAMGGDVLDFFKQICLDITAGLILLNRVTIFFFDRIMMFFSCFGYSDLAYPEYLRIP